MYLIWQQYTLYEVDCHFSRVCTPSFRPYGFAFLLFSLPVLIFLGLQIMLWKEVKAHHCRYIKCFILSNKKIHQISTLLKDPCWSLAHLIWVTLELYPYQSFLSFVFYLSKVDSTIRRLSFLRSTHSNH